MYSSRDIVSLLPINSEIVEFFFIPRVLMSRLGLLRVLEFNTKVNKVNMQ